MRERQKERKNAQRDEAIARFGYDVYDPTCYDYDLPEELIAQTPASQRDESRLLVLDKTTGQIVDEPFFKRIVDYLKPGDVLVRNDTKVIPARLIGVKEETGAKVEVLLLRQEKAKGEDVWECLVGNAKAVKVGTVVRFGEGELIAECLAVKEEGLRLFSFSYRGIFLEVLDRLGRMPLPPYIKSQLAPNDRYQTVYAKVEGSAAAPTAGFHFTPQLFEAIAAKGVEVLDVTLHVGLGTFRPVKAGDIRDHAMHAEWFTLSDEVARKLNTAKEEKRRIVAVGTTTIRTLETVAHKSGGRFQGMTGDTDIFIYPGFTWMAVDAFVTNFHLPKSTLVMLVSSFAGRENVLKAYEHAVKERYRFFSFGDAMFVCG